MTKNVTILLKHHIINIFIIFSQQNPHRLMEAQQFSALKPKGRLTALSDCGQIALISHQFIIAQNQTQKFNKLCDPTSENDFESSCCFLVGMISLLWRRRADERGGRRPIGPGRVWFQSHRYSCIRLLVKNKTKCKICRAFPRFLWCNVACSLSICLKSTLQRRCRYGCSIVAVTNAFVSACFAELDAVMGRFYFHAFGQNHTFTQHLL